MSDPGKRSIFKIISLSKQTPIFICKSPQEPTPQQEMTSSLIKVRRAKEELQKIANKLSLLTDTQQTSFLQRRSDSCDLSWKAKGSDGKTQRSMKEYLRLAYKRTQTDRRLSNPRLPSISHIHNPEQRLQQEQSAKQKSSLACLKRTKRRAQMDRLNAGISFRSELIQGWDNWRSPEQC